MLLNNNINSYIALEEIILQIFKNWKLYYNYKLLLKLVHKNVKKSLNSYH